MGAVDRFGWIPQNPWKSTYIPDHLVISLKKLHPNQDQLHFGNAFCILVDYDHNDEDGLPVFHLAFCDSSPKWTTNVVSLYRTGKILPLAVLCDRCIQFPELFSINKLLNEQKGEAVLRGLCHPLWTSDHIVSKRVEDTSISENAAMSAYFSTVLRNGEVPPADSLHFAAIWDRLDKIVSAVANSDDINHRDRHGNTALHIAVVWSNLLAVQFLICMGADVNLTNNCGHTALHLASQMKANVLRLTNSNISDHRKREKQRSLIVQALLLSGAQKCDLNVIGCTGDCIAAGRKTIVVFHCENHSNGKRKISLEERLKQVANNKAIKHVLSKLLKIRGQGKESNFIAALALDGGGIKGLCLIQLLIALEERLDGQVIDYLDWIGGTSTGAIVGAALGRGYPLRKIQRLYLRFKDVVFQRPLKSSVLESFLKEELGKDTAMADISYPKTFFTTLNAKETPCKMVLQRSYRLPGPNSLNRELHFNNPSHVKLWTALRRSTAAPTYFKVMDGKYVDGGLGANNPSSDLLAEIHRHNRLLTQTVNFTPISTFRLQSHSENVQIGCLISLGCGAPPPQKVSFRNLPKALFQIFTEQLPQTEGTSVEKTRECCLAENIPFFRLTPKLTKDVDLATRDNVKVIGAMWDAFVCTKENWHMLDQIAALLKEIGTNEKRAEVFGNDHTHG